MPGLNPTPSPPRGSLDIGDGYWLLWATDTVAHLLPASEATALHSFCGCAGVFLPDNHQFKITKWAQLALPVGQIAQCAWKEIQAALSKSGREPQISCFVKVKFKFTD